MPDQLVRDFRFALRGLRREPTFALTAILALAIGVATVTTTFSVADAELWKPLPYPHPERLVAIYSRGPGVGAQTDPIAGADLVDWRAGAPALSDWRPPAARCGACSGSRPPSRCWSTRSPRTISRRSAASPSPDARSARTTRENRRQRCSRIAPGAGSSRVTRPWSDVSSSSTTSRSSSRGSWRQTTRWDRTAICTADRRIHGSVF